MMETIVDGPKTIKPNPRKTQSSFKEDPIKLQEVKEVAKLCRKVFFLPEELMPDSSLRKVIFVTTFGQVQVDPQLEAPYFT